MNPQPTETNPYEPPLQQEVTAEAAPLRPELPLALKVVAWLTIGQGILTVIGGINSVFHDRFHIDLTFLFIPAGIGLLKLRRGWRTFTLVNIWLTLGASLLCVVFAAANKEPIELRLMGMKKGPIPDWVLIPGALLFFIVTLWQYRVLIRKDVRVLFGLSERMPGLGDR
jgi:hypothetical protein